MADPTITLTSPPLGYSYQGGSPTYVRNVSHNVIGPLGTSIYYYWVVAIYPSGTVPPPTPITVRNAPNILSPTNSVVINWVAPNGQITGYSVLRTTTPVFPGNSTTAVVINTTTNTVTDTGSALVAFTLIPVPLNRGVIYIDGTGPAPILVSTLGIKASSITFSDNTVQTTAPSTSQIYSWQQDVQANTNRLLGLGALQLVGGTFPFNLSVTPTAGAFPAGTLQITNQTSGFTPFAINQNGDASIGGPPPSPRLGRLFITTPATYAGNTANPSLYCYNAVGGLGCSIVAEATSQSARLQLKNSVTDYSLISSGTSVSTASFFVNDNSVSPGVRIIVQSGKIGIANGTAFTPAHQLELNVDDAGKPTTSTWTITSDIRTKRNTRKLEGGLSVIERLEPVESEYNGLANTPDGHRVVSFDPDELVKILPTAVSRVRRKLNVDDDEESDIAGINVHEIIFHLVLAVKQLAASSHKSKK